MNQIEYLCPNDSYVLISIHDPEFDLKGSVLPSDFTRYPEETQDLLKNRNEFLGEVLSRMNNNDRARFYDLISNEKNGSVILWCPHCETVYDSERIQNDLQEYYVHGKGTIPVKKVGHKVISNDDETIYAETVGTFEDEIESVIKSDGREQRLTTTYYMEKNERTDLNPTLKRSIQTIIEKYGEDNVSVSID